ncbi:heme/hemin ABC transporter substrate-binding protein [Qingshengfaniella alkalisoli]|uniref:ABC transporter substrate-binding protein n=1 Tax=Qingshengfaniella alkalisoli TaxID=2599296 RepID=A0A5B8IPI8_9RHOB|nr:ABC transporter substrate-binding protein [Qingshengfaniella alkalisoli]QDY68232.1 ABC transporter substrate-binding protein [Qingshengfaniella alkalisoli]
MRMLASLYIAAMVAVPAWAQENYPDASRIVSVGGSVTEIIYALGAQDRVIARDTTSNFPPEVTELPDVGYIRSLSPEGALSVEPDLILAEEGAGPPEAVDLLKEAGIPYAEMPEAFTAEGVARKIEAVGQTIGLATESQALADTFREDMAVVANRTDAIDSPKRVLFILSMQGGRIMASGADTGADGMIRLAGAVNAVSGFSGYKPLTDEAISAASPDVILMMDRGGDHGGTVDQVVSHPAISVTPAGKTGAVIRMDGLYLLGFGPRTADAAAQLHDAIYGDANGNG